MLSPKLALYVFQQLSKVSGVLYNVSSANQPCSCSPARVQPNQVAGSDTEICQIRVGLGKGRFLLSIWRPKGTRCFHESFAVNFPLRFFMRMIR